MKNHRHILQLRASVLAVHGALGFFAAAHAQTQAPDPALVELTQPKNTVEVGVGTTSAYSAKADEFNGISRKGGYLIGNVELRGGGAYDSADPTRWLINGSDLGLKSPSLEAEYGQQGRFRVKFGYEQLLRNQSDTFQTPYQGVGTNSMSLPSNWMTVVIPRLSATTPSARGLSPDVTASSAIIGGVLTPPTAAQATAAAAMQAADLPAFHNVDLFTKRTRFSLGYEQILDTRWLLSLSLSDEHKGGLRAQGAHSHMTGGDASSILPVPIDQNDRQASLGVSYTGDKFQVQAAYDVSSFNNNIDSVSWNMWSGPTIVQTMSTAPSNLFQKFSLSGSLQATPGTRVTGAAAYSRSSQNEAFLSDATAPIVPVASAQALVVNESVSLKVSNRTTKDLTLSGGYKYDLRENRTPVNTYVFYDNGEAPAGVSPFRYLFPTLPTMGTDVNIAANTPYSRRVHALNLDADYQLKAGSHIKGGVDATNTDRYCLNSWYQCVNAASSDETTVHADWFGNVTPEINTRLGLASSHRKVTYDENSFLSRVPMANQTPTGAPAGSTAYSALTSLGLNGWGPALGLAPAAPAGSLLAFYFPLNNPLSNTLYAFRNRISELQGMRRYDQADRDRNKLRSSVSWQATEKFELQGALDYSQDRYNHSVYGLQKASTGALNLDANYAANDDFSVGVFASFEQMTTRQAGNTYTANSAATNVNGATAIDGGCFATIALRNASNKIDPCLDWTSTTKDKTTTFGASFNKSRLMGGKLSLQGSFAYSAGRTDIDVTGGNYVNNPYAGIAANPTGTIAAYYIPATPLPTVKATSWDFRLTGTWQLKPDVAVRVGYGYQRLRSEDWAYEGSQDGALTQVIPTREQSPVYNIHTLGIAYIASFR